MKTMNLKKNKNGLTLLEVLVAVFILAIVAGPLLNMFVQNTRMLHVSYERTTETYDARSLMEGLYSNSYDNLFRQGTFGTPKEVPAINKYYTVDLTPGGPSGVVSGTPCYFHLIINAAGTSGTFAGADGKLVSGSLPTLTHFDKLSLTASTDGATYTLADGYGLNISGTKPAGATPVLIILTRSVNAIGITMSEPASSGVIVYAPNTFKKNKLTSNATKTVLNNTNPTPPNTLLVTAVLKTYADATVASQESVYQTTFSMGNLP